MPTALQTRLAQPDMVGLSDWQASDVLHAPDPSNPKKLISRLIGIGGVLLALGISEGSALLSVIEGMAGTNSEMKWILVALQKDGLDMGLPAVREKIDAFATAGILTVDQRDILKALGEGDYQSWAEANAVEVNPTTVGEERKING